MIKRNVILLAGAAAFALSIGSLPACAQQAQPQPATTSSQPATTQSGDTAQKEVANAANPKNDRIFLIIPNYTTVEVVPVAYMPLSVGEKFKLGAEDAFDPYSFPLAAILAAKAQASNDDASWGQGWKGYGKRYAAGFGDATIGSFMTTGVFPSLLHEDPRYFREGHGGFWHRSGYAVKRLFVIRTDSDKEQFNISEFAGNAAAAGISMTYHSPDERSLSSFASDWATQISIDFLANQLKEFWPDIRHKIFKGSKST